MLPEWTYLKVEVEKGVFFWFGGPWELKTLWGFALEILGQFGKPFPLSMKQTRSGSFDRGVIILPPEGTNEINSILASPAFHLYSGVPKAVVDAQMAALDFQLSTYRLPGRD